MGRPYNEKADVWSCGVIMYLLIMNSFPFDAEKDEDLGRLIVNYKIDWTANRFKKMGVKA